MPVRLDGTTVRGARDAEGNQRHLLAALAGPAVQSPVIAPQAEVGAKTNEVPMATQVPGQIDLNDKIVTAHALHTVKATAEFIRDHGAVRVEESRLAPEPLLTAVRDRTGEVSPSDLLGRSTWAKQ